MHVSSPNLFYLIFPHFLPSKKNHLFPLLLFTSLSFALLLRCFPGLSKKKKKKQIEEWFALQEAETGGGLPSYGQRQTLNRPNSTGAGATTMFRGPNRASDSAPMRDIDDIDATLVKAQNNGNAKFVRSPPPRNNNSEQTLIGSGLVHATNSSDLTLVAGNNMRSGQTTLYQRDRHGDVDATLYDRDANATLVAPNQRGGWWYVKNKSAKF